MTGHSAECLAHGINWGWRWGVSKDSGTDSVCIHVHMCVCLCVHVYRGICAYVWMSVCEWLHVYVCICTCAYVSVYVYEYEPVCMCVCVYRLGSRTRAGRLKEHWLPSLQWLVKVQRVTAQGVMRSETWAHSWHWQSPCLECFSGHQATVPVKVPCWPGLGPPSFLLPHLMVLTPGLSSLLLSTSRGHEFLKFHLDSCWCSPDGSPLRAEPHGEVLPSTPILRWPLLTKPVLTLPQGMRSSFQCPLPPHRWITKCYYQWLQFSRCPPCAGHPILQIFPPWVPQINGVGITSSILLWWANKVSKRFNILPEGHNY